MRLRARETMAREAADWHHAGLVGGELAARLAQRYDQRGHFMSILLKWLGAFALLQLGLAVLAFVGMVVGSEGFGAMLLGGAAAGLWLYGARLATDPLDRYAFTGSIVITVGLAAAYGTLVLLYMAAGGQRFGDAIPVMMLAVAAASLYTAYRHYLRWPLLLGLLMLFHGLGAWDAYGGYGTYFADIQEPRSMAVIAVITAVLGLWHERVGERTMLRRAAGFGHLYVIFGLLYLNLSLWFLTIPHGPLAWVLIFTAACVAQIVAGARLKDARWTGFGIVFLAIDLYTRFFEHFWDRLSLGICLLVGGAVAMALGYGFERQGEGRWLRKGVRVVP